MAKHKGPIRSRPHSRQDIGGRKIVKSGRIELPAGSIPTPTASSAMNFARALMEGNPIAMKAADDALADDELRSATGGIHIPAGAPMSDVHDAINKMAGKPEDEASVADKFVAATYEWPKFLGFTAKQTKAAMPLIMAYRQAMKRANKFVLDKEFVEYATHISSNTTPEKLLARIGFATLPYETTWIEFDLMAKVRAMRAHHGLTTMPDGVAPRMGVLMERINDTMCTVTMVCESTDIIMPNLTGYVFSVDERTLHFNQVYHGMTPFDAAYRVDRLKRMPMFEDVMHNADAADIMHRVAHGTLWGYAGGASGVLHNSRELIDNIRVPEFLARHGELAFSRFYDVLEGARLTQPKVMEGMSKVITDEITEFSGMMRWLVTVLAMLNEVPTRANFVQPMHTMRHGLTVRAPAFDYHRLTLRLPKTKPIPYIVRFLSNVERKHKAHNVRQHWRTYLHVNQACRFEEHEWEYDEEHGYALCGKCMGYRRRIPEHVRGDPSLGWVHKEYLIKPTKQE